MKIDDLIRPKIRKYKGITKRKFWDDRYAKNKNDDSTGTFSFVEPDKNPHHINKKSKYEFGNIGFDTFAKYVLENQNSNPFLPRIYNVSIRQNKEGNNVIDYKMEKLLKWNFVPFDSLRSLLISLFEFNIDSEELEHVSIDYLIGHILSILEDKKYDKIKSVKLARTVADLAQFTSEDEGLDFSEDNVLFRMTPYGPQLVLSDPIGYLNKAHRIKFKRFEKDYLDDEIYGDT